MKNFEELYSDFKNDEEIKKIGQEVIGERKKRNKITWIICLIVSAVVIYFLINFLNRFHLGTFAILFLIVPIMMVNLIIMVITTFIYSKKQREFTPIFKEKIIKNMINNFFSDTEYYPEKPMLQATYKEGKYEFYDNFYSDDYIKAKIDEKYLIELADVKTEKEETVRDSDGHTHTERRTIFCGLFAKIIIDKSINSKLRITQGLWGGNDKLEMDSSEFEKKFNVYASNSIIGMQILTADVMNEILEFKNRIKDYFDIFIDYDKIYLRFHCGFLFEPYFRKNNILDERSLKSYYDILKFTYELTNRIIKVINDVEI